MESTQKSSSTPGQGSRTSPRVSMGGEDGTAERTSRSPASLVNRQSTSYMSRHVRASPSSPAGSVFLDYTRRTAVEAQAQRTSVRLMELEMAAKNEELAQRFQGGQPDVGSPALGDSPPAYPGTAARQNVTVRRSRDRLSAASREVTAPENITSRLSNRRTRDVRYSIQSDGDSRGTSAVFYRKQHGREIQEAHLRDRGSPLYWNQHLVLTKWRVQWLPLTLTR